MVATESSPAPGKLRHKVLLARGKKKFVQGAYYDKLLDEGITRAVVLCANFECDEKDNGLTGRSVTVASGGYESRRSMKRGAPRR